MPALQEREPANQGIHSVQTFPSGVDYLFTCDTLCREGAGRRKLPLNSSRSLREFLREGTILMSPLH